MSAKEVIEILGHHIYLLKLSYVSTPFKNALSQNDPPDFFLDIVVDEQHLYIKDKKDEILAAHSKLISAWKELRQ